MWDASVTWFKLPLYRLSDQESKITIWDTRRRIQVLVHRLVRNSNSCSHFSSKCSNFNNYGIIYAISIDMTKHMMPTSFMPHLYQDLPPIGNKFAAKLNDSNSTTNPGHGNLDLDISTSMIPSFGSKLGLLLPDPAPDVAPNPEKILSSTPTTQMGVSQTST